MLCMQHWPIEWYLCINMAKMHRLSQHIIGEWMKSHALQVVTHITYSLSTFWLGCYFKLQDVKVTFYVWGDHIFTIMTCSPFYLKFVFYLNIFVIHVSQILLFEAFYFLFAPSCVNGYKYINTWKKIHIWWNYQIKNSSITFQTKKPFFIPKN
jgi:hypothetical protein